MKKPGKSKTAQRNAQVTEGTFAEVRAVKAHRVKDARSLFRELNASAYRGRSASTVSDAHLRPGRSENLVALAVGRALDRKPRVNAELLKIFRANSDLLLGELAHAHAPDGRMLGKILGYLQEAGGTEIDRLRWFLTPSFRLAGHTPFDLLRTGRIHEVVEAAHARADIGR